MDLIKKMNCIQVEAHECDTGTPGTFVITAECSVMNGVKAGINFWVYIPELFKTELYGQSEVPVRFQEVSIDYFTDDKDADWDRDPSILGENDVNMYARRDDDTFFFRIENDESNIIVSIPISKIGMGTDW